MQSSTSLENTQRLFSFCPAKYVWDVLEKLSFSGAVHIQILQRYVPPLMRMAAWRLKPGVSPNIMYFSNLRDVAFDWCISVSKTWRSALFWPTWSSSLFCDMSLIIIIIIITVIKMYWLESPVMRDAWQSSARCNFCQLTPVFQKTTENFSF